MGTLGNNSRQGGTQCLISSHREQKTRTDSGHRCGDTRGEGHVACPAGVNLQGLSSEGRVRERGVGWGGEGPQFGSHGQFPSSTRQQPERGGGSSWKHWWLQAAGGGVEGRREANGVPLAWPGPQPAPFFWGEPPASLERLTAAGPPSSSSRTEGWALPAQLPRGRGLTHLS